MENKKGKLKISDCLFASIYTNFICVEVDPTKINHAQAQLLAYLTDSKTMSSVLPHLKVKAPHTYQLTCEGCGRPFNSIFTYELDSNPPPTLQHVKYVLGLVIEGYLAMLEYLIKNCCEEFCFGFTNAVFEAGCVCGHKQIVLLDIGANKRGKTLTASGMQRLFEELCANLSERNASVEKMVGAFFDNQHFSHIQLFYEGMVKIRDRIQSKKGKDTLRLFTEQQVNIKSDKNCSEEKRRKTNRGRQKSIKQNAFAIEKFLRIVTPITKSNRTKLTLSSRSPKQSRKSSTKRKPYLFKINTKHQTPLANPQKQELIIHKLTLARNSLNKSQNKGKSSVPITKRDIQWEEIQKISQQIHKNNHDTTDSVEENQKDKEEKQEKNEKLNLHQRENKDDGKGEKNEGILSLVLTEIEKKFSQQINPLSEGINKTRILLQQYNEKSLIPLFLLYKKFFYLRTTFLALLSSPDKPILPNLSHQEWLEVLEHPTFRSQIKKMLDENKQILKLVQDNKIKVQVKIQKKALLQSSKQGILEIDIEDEQIYNSFTNMLIITNYQKYIKLFEVLIMKDSKAVDLYGLYEYGAIILLAIKGDMDWLNQENIPEVKNNISQNSRIKVHLEQQKKFLQELYNQAIYRVKE